MAVCICHGLQNDYRRGPWSCVCVSRVQQRLKCKKTSVVFRASYLKNASGNACVRDPQAASYLCWHGMPHHTAFLILLKTVAKCDTLVWREPEWVPHQQVECWISLCILLYVFCNLMQLCTLHTDSSDFSLGGGEHKVQSHRLTCSRPKLSRTESRSLHVVVPLYFKVIGPTVP